MIAIKSLAAIFTYIISLCGIIPIFPWLSPFPQGVLIVGFFAGLWQEKMAVWPIKPWMQNIAIIPVFVYYSFQFSYANAVQPVTSLLAIMLAVRLLGEKTVRHTLQIYALSMFCLASSSLFDLRPLFLIYLGLLLFLVALALVLLTFQNQDSSMTVTGSELRRILLFGLLMPLGALPLLLLFFPILPRTQMPLWHFLSPPSAKSSGYTDSVEPGSQSSITESGSLAFRAEMPRQGPHQLYWRGTVFNRTDGNKWTRIPQIPTEEALFSGKTVTQIISPEVSASRTLIALDRPISLSLPRKSKSPDGVFELLRQTGNRISYSAESYITGLVAQRNLIKKEVYLQLPDQLPSRITALAAEIVHAGDNKARVQFLEEYFRNGGYRYSTKDLATGTTALETFLFEKKQGHCEFFASSFALLLRSAGVPCRLVGGYLGGEYNEFGGYYLVTDAKAHVWVEAYLEGAGWVRIDPSSFAANSGEVWKTSGARSLTLRFSLLIDSFNYKWNRSVITYDFEQQVTIARQVTSHFQGITPLKTVRVVAPYLAGMMLLVALLFALRRSSLFMSRESLILKRFLRIGLLKFIISSKLGEAGLFEIAAAADNENVNDFVSIYADAIYHDRKLTDAEYRHLQQLLTILKGVASKIS